MSENSDIVFAGVTEPRLQAEYLTASTNSQLKNSVPKRTLSS